MAEGIWIEIGGAVQRKLLKSLEELQKELRELAYTARTTLNVQFGAGLERLSERVQEVRDETEKSLDHMARTQRKYASSAEESVSRATGAYRKEMGVLSELKDERDKAVEEQLEEGDKIKDFFEDYRKMTQEKWSVVPTDTEALQSYRTDLNKLKNDLERLQPEFEALGGAGEEVFYKYRQEILRVQNDLKRGFSPALRDIRRQIEEYEIAGKLVPEEEARDARQRLLGIAREINRLRRTGEVEIGPARAMLTRIGRLRRAYREQLIPTIDDVRKKYNQLATDIESLEMMPENQIKKVKSRLQSVSGDLERLYEQGKITGDTYVKEGEKIESTFKRIQTRLEDVDSAYARLTEYELEPVSERSQERLKQFQSDVSSLETRFKTLYRQDLIDREQLEETREVIAGINKRIADQREVFSKARSEEKRYEARMEKARETLVSVQKEVERLNQLRFELIDPANFNTVKSRISTVRSYITKYQDDFRELDDVSDESLNNLIENVNELDRSLSRAGGVQKTRKNITDLTSSLDRLRKRQETLDIWDPESVRYYNQELSVAESKLKALRGVIPDAAIKGFESRISRARSVLNKTGDSLGKTESELAKLRTRIDEINKTPFKAIPEGQLPERLKEIRRLNSQLYKVYQNNELNYEEWKKLSDILGVSDRKLSKLLATTEEYYRTGNRTAGITTRLLRRFRALSRVLTQQAQLWGILGGVIVGIQAAYAALATWATKAAASLGENARKLNMTTQALSEFQTAAIMTGTSTRDLNDALSSLSDSVMDALQGKDKAVNAFDELSIGFDTLVKHGNDTEKMFQLVMERLGGLDSAAKRLSLAKDIFGKGPASTLINLTGNLEEARNAMEQFNITMSEESVRAAENFWNKMRGLWLVIKRQFISASVEAIDTMEKFADRLLNVASKGNIFEGTIVPAVETTVGVLKNLITAARGLYKVLHLVYEAWDYLLVPIKAFMGYMLVTYINKLTAGVWAFARSVRAATGAMERFWAVMEGIGKFVGYFLLIEGVVKLVEWLGKAQRVAKETELTFKEAFKAIVEDAFKIFFVEMIPAMARAGKEWATALATSFWNGLKLFPKRVGMLMWSLLPGGKSPAELKRKWHSEGKKAGEEYAKGVKEGSSPEEIYEKWKENRDKINEVMSEDWFKKYDKTSPLKQRLELIKSSVEETSQSIVSSVEKMAEAGRTADLKEMLPFASDVVQEKIDDTKERLEAVSNTIKEAKSRRAGPWPLAEMVAEIPDEDLRKQQQLSNQLAKLRDKLKKLKNEAPMKAELNKFQKNMTNAVKKIRAEFPEELFPIKFREKKLDVLKQFKDKYKGLRDEAKKLYEQEKISQEFYNKVLGLNLDKTIEVQEAQRDLWKTRLETHLSTAKKERDTRLKTLKSDEEATKETHQKKIDILNDHQENVKQAYNLILGEMKKAGLKDTAFYKQILAEKEEALKESAEREIEIREKEGDRIQGVWEEDAEARRNALERRLTDIKIHYENENRSVIESYEVKKRYLENEVQAHQQHLDEMMNNEKFTNKDIKKERGKLKEFQDRLQTHELENYKEYNRAKIEEFGSFVEKTKLGLKRVDEEFASSTRHWSDYIVDVARNMKNAFADAFSDFIMGTKSAGEAFGAFAKDVIRDIADIMAQQAAEDIIGGFFRTGGFLLSSFSGSGAGGGGAQFAGPPAGTFASSAHKGGVVGRDLSSEVRMISQSLLENAPKLHNGLKSDEYPTILEKGEGVFTQEQMKALGKNSAPEFEVNVINKTGQEATAKKSEPKWEGNRWVMSVVLDAANRNKDGFGKNLKAALGKT